MPPLASLVFLSCSRSLTSPRYRAFPPASQAARSLMAREKQMPPLASLVFLSCSRSLTSPRCRAFPPASQAARSLMAREKQMPPLASLVFLSCSLYREHSSLNNFAVRDEQASPVPALLRSLYHIFPCDDTAEKGAACLFRCTQRLSFDRI